MARTTRSPDMKHSLFSVGSAALVSLALAGSGCAKHVEAESSASSIASLSEYYPLAVGNRWTYRVNGRDDKAVTVEIVKEEAGFFLDSQGGQLAVDGFGLRDPKRYLLRGPLETGRSWTNVVSVSSTERYQILQAGASCEAPAGTFQNCVQVEGRNRVDTRTTLINTMTFAPGVGMVRVEVAAEHDGQRVPQTSLSLESFQLRPAASPPAPTSPTAG
ncbi:hypothetical protein DRW03_08080 [Corallococcus sp. H22C18031201]|nr:hypothetical protein [Citreicoccus inhibens]RJS25068.1 hypothetical protein DRW03_08080 [Corallococcus sp. H22C18031201]